MKNNFPLFTSLLLLATALSSGYARAATTVGTFTGGDPGEGLDMQGNFTYAINVGPSGDAGRVGDAVLIADTAAGVTINAVNSIGNGGWGACNYGDTDNDKNLAFAMNSIRWTAAPGVVTVTLKVEKGAEYKLQLLFHEDCCPGRGFNIIINGKVELTNVIPGALQAEAGMDDFANVKNTIGVVVTSQFVAPDTDLVIVLDGAAADDPTINDHNAILNGFTLERLSPFVDTDNDGLKDDWESKFFGGLDAKPGDDADGDGLTNLEEQTVGTDPTKADTDGDKLNDSEEVHTYKTDPLKNGDADGDLVTDANEIVVHHTDIGKADTDGDGFSDYYEIHFLTDPLDPKSMPKRATANRFYGPDAGQGLDLAGTFPYAVSFGNATAGGQIHDANFLSSGYGTGGADWVDSIPGVTTVAMHANNGWNVGVNFGDSPEQTILSDIMLNIQWSEYVNATTPTVTVSLDNLQVGGTYKLQLLFAEYLWARGFDIAVNDRTLAKAFAPFHWQGGLIDPAFPGLQLPQATPRTNGVVVTYNFVANKTQAVVVLDGRGQLQKATDPWWTGIGDGNAIIQGLTLETISGPADSDSDGLWDAWEMDFFGNLNQKATDDPDGDGLTNAQEFTAGSDPDRADTDKDGLTDGEEVNTSKTLPGKSDTDDDTLTDYDEVKVHKSDPLKTDGDGDGLSDGNEIRVYLTDPAKADTDGDGLADGVEVDRGTNPTVAEPKTVFSNIVAQMITGGDPGEGLDLQGNFLYAVNVSSAGAAGKAGDADFTADDVPGVTVTASNNLPAWDMPEYGDTAADNVIEKVTQSIRYTPQVKVVLTGLVPGTTYKLQLLYYEQCCANRGFNVYADGELLAADFVPTEVQGGVNTVYSAAVISAEFVTQRDNLVIMNTVKGVTREDLTDPNAILDGFTLEILKESPLPPKPTISAYGFSAGAFTLTVNTVSGKLYTLEYKANISDATWTTGEQKTATGTTLTFTDNTPAHLGGTGFWRVKAQ